MNTPIKLYNKTQGCGASAPTETDVVEALCSVERVGAMIGLQAYSTGIKLERQVTMWAMEYKEQVYCLIDNQEYIIQQATKTGYDMTVKLLLSKE